MISKCCLCFLRKLVVKFQLCCPTAAGWIKRRPLRCFIWITKVTARTIELRTLFSLVVSCILLSRKCDCFIVVVLQWEDLGRIQGLFCSDRSITFPWQGHREGEERVCVCLIYSTDIDVYLYVCVIYLTVSQVSLQLGDFLPQFLQLFLAGLHLLPLFSFLPLPLILQPLDDTLLDRGKGKGKEKNGEGMEVRKRETERDGRKKVEDRERQARQKEWWKKRNRRRIKSPHTLQQSFTVTQYQVSILITVALNLMYMAALTGSNSQRWF